MPAFFEVIESAINLFIIKKLINFFSRTYENVKRNANKLYFRRRHLQFALDFLLLLLILTCSSLCFLFFTLFLSLDFFLQFSVWRAQKAKSISSSKMGGGEGQTYCLRWNNHKSNLVEILDGLFQRKSYVDCTLQVDDSKFFVHRVVLAANSSYFQQILQDVPMDHCTIIFPGVASFEMQALLDYMYTGEVNVTQSQIPRIIQIAEQLEVKGLFDMTDLKDKFDKIKMDEPTFSSNLNSMQSPQMNNNKLPNNQHSSPIISQSTNISSSVQSSSSSPPYSYKNNYPNMFAQSPIPSSSDCPPPQWPIPPSIAAAAGKYRRFISFVCPLFASFRFR